MTKKDRKEERKLPATGKRIKPRRRLRSNGSGQEALPLIPLRGIVSYPGVLLSFDVGRERSIRALNHAMRGKHELILAGQLDMDDPLPDTDDIHTVGTRVLVRQVLELAENSYKILAFGLERVEILAYTREDDFYEVTYRRLEPIEEEVTPQHVASGRLMATLFRRYAGLTERIAPEAVAMVQNDTNLGHAADMIAGQMSIRPEEQQLLLETRSVTERIRLVLQFLQREIQLAELEAKIAADVQSRLDKNQRDYYLREQLRAIQEELGDEVETTEEIEEMRNKLEASGIPDEYKPKLRKEIDRLSRMPSHFPEYNTQRTWLDILLELPFGKTDEPKRDIAEARRILERDHYGMDKLKERIIEHIAVYLLQAERGEAIRVRGPILCLVGPPGVGKTSIARAIAEALGRRYIRISLGGIRDEAEIRGHRRTYIGSMPGRIIQGIRQVGIDNPLFLLDEVDKLGDDFRGDPSSALLEVLDPEQNHSFRDHYIELPYDLSKVLFVTTANTVDTIPPPLLDRMEILEVSGYTEAEKIEIAVRHLIPRARERHGLTGKHFRVTRKALAKLIQGYTAEAGVRQLEREIAHLCRRVAVQIAEGDERLITVTPTKLPELLGNPRYSYDMAEKKPQIGVATGLAWTWAGGDTLTIEVNVMEGSGKLLLTGKLGDVMKESAQAALTYIMSRATELGLDAAETRKKDIHIHVPAGAIPKDGPSAGITLATALASALTGRPVRPEVAMTGEVTLRGRVLPIGGLKEKSVAAGRANIKKVLIPKENERDLDDIPETVKAQLDYVTVSHMDDVLKEALLPEKAQ